MLKQDMEAGGQISHELLEIAFLGKDAVTERPGDVISPAIIVSWRTIIGHAVLPCGGREGTGRQQDLASPDGELQIRGLCHCHSDGNIQPSALLDNLWISPA